YYKGDEKNPQLQRVYGTAFKTKRELDDYFAMLEEAKKRDHRKLGKELELFIFDDDVGPGLPMFLPRGAVIAEELEKLAKETEFAAGYLRVRTPQIARESMYLKSGHLPYYAESMFPPMKLPASEESLARLVLARDDYEAALFAADGLEGVDLGAVSESDRGKVSRLFSGYWAYMRLLKQYQDARPTEEDPADVRSKLEQEVRDLQDQFAHIAGKEIDQLTEHERVVAQQLFKKQKELKELEGAGASVRYYLKAMNSPHHHKLFAAVPRSYRDLPLRFAEYG